ncbi:MAG: hypothetical protein L0H96_20495 [Humibacillus sp.]|nr:hypothetical protein [Humibacillus sp.]MDN5779277.1 hypothetical protein [Humibacillus sp.]
MSDAGAAGRSGRTSVRGPAGGGAGGLTLVAPPRTVAFRCSIGAACAAPPPAEVALGVDEPNDEGDLTTTDVATGMAAASGSAAGLTE